MSSWIVSILSILLVARMLSPLKNAPDATPEDGTPAYVVSAVQPVSTATQPDASTAAPTVAPTAALA